MVAQLHSDPKINLDTSGNHWNHTSQGAFEVKERQSNEFRPQEDRSSSHNRQGSANVTNQPDQKRGNMVSKAGKIVRSRSIKSEKLELNTFWTDSCTT